MNRKKVYFCFFVIVSTALLVYSVVDRYDKELPKELAEFSWQRSVCFDYPFFLFFFGFLPVSFAVVGKDFRRKEERKSHSMFFRVKRWLHMVAPPLGLLLFTFLFLFFSDSCANKKLVFSWDQVIYIGFVFILHVSFCYCLWVGYFSD